MASPNTDGKSMSKALKNYLITGILVWLPILVTIWVITYIIGAADSLMNILPKSWQPKSLFGFNIHGVGIIVALVVLFCTGVFAANVLGKHIIAIGDALLCRIPVVKSIYTSVKKVSESLLSDSRQSFKTPVLVPFPQPDTWSIGFVSGKIPDSVTVALAQPTHDNIDYVSVYVPTTPNPTGGYYIMVKHDDVKPLNMSVDDALKYIISLGMVRPTDINTKQQALPLDEPKPNQ